MRFVVCFFAFLIVALPALAAQIKFDMNPTQRTVFYDYVWRDHAGQKHAMSFRLPRPHVEHSAQDFQPFDNNEATNFVYTMLKKYADIPRKGVNLVVEKNPDGVRYGGNGVRHLVKQELEAMYNLQESAFDLYIKDNLYARIAKEVVMPDHPRIAHIYAERMRPVAKAAVERIPNNRDTRAVVNFVLSFLQSIPYDTLLDRRNSNGSGFDTPINVLTSNRADCDSKSVALASILRNIYPQMRMVMVYIPGHAFIGMDVPSKTSDLALRIDGTNFVLAEPAGPAVMPMGTVSRQSVSRLRQRNFSYQEIPKGVGRF